MEEIIIDSLTSEVPLVFNTNGHCFLCLKDAGILSSWGLVTGNPKGVDSFGYVLCYLTGYPDHEEEDSDNQELLKVIGDDLPPLCIECYNNVAELHGLHQELVEIQRRIQEKTRNVREHVLKTSSARMEGEFEQSRRDKFIESMGNSELPLDQISSISGLVLRIHERIISVGATPVAFPSVVVTTEEEEQDLNVAPLQVQAITDAFRDSEDDGPSKKRRRHSASSDSGDKSIDASLGWSIESMKKDEQLRPPEISSLEDSLKDNEGLSTAAKQNLEVEIQASPPAMNATGMNVCGVPVDPSANYVMITTNVTDPETGAVTVQPVLLNVAQLIPQVHAAVTTSVLPPAIPSSTPHIDTSNTVSLSKKRSKRKRRKGGSHDHLNPSTAYSHYETELRLQLCDVCNERIPRGPHGTSHLACHVGAEYVSYCKECEYVYVSPFRLREFHISRHLPCTPDPVPIFKCDLCPYQAEWMHNLRKHFKEHEKDPHLPDNFNCPLCPLKFRSKKMVQLHLGDRHVFLSKTSGRQTCDICKSYFNVKEIEDHLLTHGVTLLFRCKMCLSMFSNLDSLIKHQGYAKQKGQHEKVCHLCENVTKFMTLTALRTHYFEVHNLGSKFVCELCNDEFLTKEKWEQHLERFHTNKKKVLVTPSSSKISEILAAAADNPVEDVVINDKSKTVKKNKQKWNVLCPDCGDVRVARYQLLKHRIEKHNYPPLTCSDPYCEETFTSEKDRKLHVASLHQGFTVLPPKNAMCPLKCEDCGAEFTNRGKLNDHRKKHSNERPFACELCESKYKSRHALNLHMMYTHLKMEKKRRFMCDICDKGFFTEKMLSSHKLIHAGERPYACQHCGQRFRQEAALWTHEKSHAKLGDKFRPKGEMERKK